MIFIDWQNKCASGRHSSFIIYLIWFTKTLMILSLTEKDTPAERATRCSNE